MQTKDPDPIEPLDHTQHPAHEVMDAAAPPQSSLWSGWRGPLIGALLAVITVFAVLDMGRLLFPLGTQGTARPIIIQVQNGTGDTGTTVAPALAASPQSLDLRCGQSAAVTLTNTASYSIHWTLDMPSSGIVLSVNSPHGGGLAPGEHTVLQVVSLGQSTTATLHVTETRGSTLDVNVRVRC